MDATGRNISLDKIAIRLREKENAKFSRRKMASLEDLDTQQGRMLDLKSQVREVNIESLSPMTNSQERDAKGIPTQLLGPMLSKDQIKRCLDGFSFPKYEHNQDHLEFVHQIEKMVSDMIELGVPKIDIGIKLYAHMTSSSLAKPFTRKASVRCLDSTLKTIRDLDPSWEDTIPTEYFMKAKLGTGEDWTHFIGRVEDRFDRYIPNATKAQKLKAIKAHFFRETKVSVKIQMILGLQDDLTAMARLAKELAIKEKDQEIEQRQVEQRLMEQRQIELRQIEQRMELRQVGQRQMEQRHSRQILRWRSWGNGQYPRPRNHPVPSQGRDFHGKMETSRDKQI